MYGSNQSIKIKNNLSQVDMISCGSIEEPLPGKGEYPAYLACNLFCKKKNPCKYRLDRFLDTQNDLNITQDDKDVGMEPGQHSEWDPYSLLLRIWNVKV